MRGHLALRQEALRPLASPVRQLSKSPDRNGSSKSNDPGSNNLNITLPPGWQGEGQPADGNRHGENDKGNDQHSSNLNITLPGW